MIKHQIINKDKHIAAPSFRFHVGTHFSIDITVIIDNYAMTKNTVYCILINFAGIQYSILLYGRDNNKLYNVMYVISSLNNDQAPNDFKINNKDKHIVLP